MTESQASEFISTRLHRIAELAKQSPQMSFRSLNHYLTLDLLRLAYSQTRKSGAVGIDSQTAQEFAVNLEDNLRSLLERAKSGSYRAPAVRRTYILKGDGRSKRPLGIPTFGDKVLQRAVVMILEPIYEQDFLSCSYGYRKKHTPHQALESLRNSVMRMRGGWVLDVDVRKFFDTLDHRHLMEILRRRVSDGVILRLIGKWLNAGVLEDGELSYPEAGTPQGGVISPLLANIYLHDVLDVWFEQMVRPVMYGPVHLVRYADDFVMVFAREDDARRVWEVLPKRFEKYGLRLHPEKTRLLAFRRPSGRAGRSDPSGEHFAFLGFTHYWARSRRGFWVVKQKTAKDRLARAVRKVYEWCRLHRHWKIREQHSALCVKLRGHLGYYGITGNSRCLWRFRRAMEKAWFKWLNRRSQRPKSWAWFQRVLQRYPLPPAIAVHSDLRRPANP